MSFAGYKKNGLIIISRESEMEILKKHIFFKPDQMFGKHTPAGPRDKQASGHYLQVREIKRGLPNPRQMDPFHMSVIRKNQFLTEPCLLKLHTEKAAAGDLGR